MITINGGGGARIKGRQVGVVTTTAGNSGSVIIAPVEFAKTEIRFHGVNTGSPDSTNGYDVCREVRDAVVARVNSDGLGISWEVGDFIGSSQKSAKIYWEIVSYE